MYKNLDLPIKKDASSGTTTPRKRMLKTFEKKSHTNLSINTNGSCDNWKLANVIIFINLN